MSIYFHSYDPERGVHTAAMPGQCSRCQRKSQILIHQYTEEYSRHGGKVPVPDTCFDCILDDVRARAKAPTVAEVTKRMLQL